MARKVEANEVEPMVTILEVSKAEETIWENMEEIIGKTNQNNRNRVSTKGLYNKSINCEELDSKFILSEIAVL